MDDITTRVYGTLNTAYGHYGEFGEIVNTGLASSIAAVLSDEACPDDEKYAIVYDLIDRSYEGAASKYSTEAVFYTTGRSNLIPSI